MRHVHNILSGALGAVVPTLIPSNPAATANPPTGREILAQERDFPTLDDDGTARFLTTMWESYGNRACHGGLTPSLPPGRPAVDRLRRHRSAAQ